MGSQRPRGPRIGIAIDPAALRRAREDAGLSLAQVAGTELTRQAVHLIEAGKVRPTARSLRIIARRLGVSESALLVAPGPRPDERVIAELQALCQVQDWAQAAEQAETLVRAGASAQVLAFAHHYAAIALYHSARPAEALSHIREARDRFHAMDNPWWVAESLDWEAIVLHMLEDPSALRVGRRALRRYLALEPRLPETEARIHQHLGTIAYGRRDYEGGRAAYEAALAVEGGVRELARMARVYHGLAMCLHGLHEHRQAADLLFKTVTLYEAEQRIAAAPMRQDLPRVENDLGLVLMEQGDLERAEQLLLAAYDHFEEAGTERFQSHTLLSLADLRQRQHRLDEALAHVRQAIERAGALGETYTLINGHRQLGEIHEARGENALADASFQRALALCADAGMPEREQQCMRAYERVLAERRESRRRSHGQTATA